MADRTWMPRENHQLQESPSRQRLKLLWTNAGTKAQLVERSLRRVRLWGIVKVRLNALVAAEKVNGTINNFDLHLQSGRSFPAIPACPKTKRI